MSESSARSAPARPVWVWVNVLGLDAVLAAVVWARLFSSASRARLIWEEYAVLAGVTWVLYMGDRMLDGFMQSAPRQDRHRFAARHWKLLVPLLAAVLAGCTWLSLYRLPLIVAVTGVKLGAGIAVYYVLTIVIRKNLAGLTGGLAACGCMAVALMQGNLLRVDDITDAAAVWPHLWRGALAGLLLTVLLVTVRRPGAPAPWLLPRKLMGGWLFAMGAALASFSHVEWWHELLFSPPVLTFGAVCAVNSLGIRLAESAPHDAADFEITLMRRLYPWVLVLVLAGTFTEWHATYPIARPFHAAAAAAASLLAVLYLLRNRMPAHLYRALADLSVILPGAAVWLWLWWLKR